MAEAFTRLGFVLAGSISFGVWQHSLAAGIVAFVILIAIARNTE